MISLLILLLLEFYRYDFSSEWYMYQKRATPPQLLPPKVPTSYTTDTLSSLFFLFGSRLGSPAG